MTRHPACARFRKTRGKTFSKSLAPGPGGRAHDPPRETPAALAALDAADAGAGRAADHARRRHHVRLSRHRSAGGDPHDLLGSALQPAIRGLHPAAAAGQGRAADPHRHRSVDRLPRRDMEHRRRGAIHHGRHLRRRRGAGILPRRQRADLPADDPLRRARRLCLGDDPGAAEGAFRHQRDPRVADAGLRGREPAGLGRLEPAAQSRGHGLSRQPQFQAMARRP